MPSTEVLLEFLTLQAVTTRLPIGRLIPRVIGTSVGMGQHGGGAGGGVGRGGVG